MSVDKTQYLFYGISIPCEEEDFDDEKYSKFYRNEIDGITVVADGMCGDYCLIGKILIERDCDYKQEFLGDDRPLDIESLMPSPEQRQVIKESILKHFGIDQECKLYVLTHFH